MADIKRVVQRIYNFNLKDCMLLDGDEMISTDHGNEFVNTFISRDLDKGIIITPSGYSRGLVYKSTNDGEFYNSPQWLPDIVTFSLNAYGLKKNAFYRITVEGRNVSKYNNLVDVTDDRTLEVSNDEKELILKKDFENDMSNVTVEGIFRATSVEENIHFRMGKIYISDIIIDEIELASEVSDDEDIDQDFELDSGKSNIVGYGVFASSVEGKNRYQEVQRITGKGINLYFDKNENCYILERDNYEDTVGASFTNANYVVDFSLTKAPYINYIITDVSNDASPNTLKQGFIKFILYDPREKELKPILYDRPNGRLTFTIKKIN